MHQDRGDIGAEAVKCAVPHRELAVEAGQQIEAEDRQPVDHHLGQLEDDKALEHEGQHHRDHQNARQHPMAGRGPGRPLRAVRPDGGCEECGILWRRRHTRLTTLRPKIPAGRTISTATITNSAIVSFRSRPK